MVYKRPSKKRHIRELSLNPVYQRVVYVLTNSKMEFIDHLGNLRKDYQYARIFSQRSRASLALAPARRRTGDDTIYIMPCIMEQLEITC